MKTRIARLRGSEGFTLIELLIVVVIIGILAAIAIPQFASTKQKAFEATAKSDLRNLMTSQEAYYADFQEYANATTDLSGWSLSNSIKDATVATTPSGIGYTASITLDQAQGGKCYGVSTDSAAANPGQVELDQPDAC